VVIAIIALLVSILLPSLNSAKDIAREVTCSVNLKNLGMGLMLYEDDDKYFPLSHDGLTFWYQKLYARFIEADGGFFCPSDPYAGMQPPLLTQKTSIDTLRYNVSYGVNEAGPCPYPDTTRNPASPYIWINSSMITHASELILAGDSQDEPFVDYGNGGWRIVIRGYPSNPERYGVGERHRESGNTVFCDGHVERLDWDFLNDKDNELTYWVGPQTDP
jgi:prepilin-type processing-associated H-X9-DG protein